MVTLYPDSLLSARELPFAAIVRGSPKYGGTISTDIEKFALETAVSALFFQQAEDGYSLASVISMVCNAWKRGGWLVIIYKNAWIYDLFTKRRLYLGGF